MKEHKDEEIVTSAFSPFWLYCLKIEDFSQYWCYYSRGTEHVQSLANLGGIPKLFADSLQTSTQALEYSQETC